MAEAVEQACADHFSYRLMISLRGVDFTARTYLEWWGCVGNSCSFSLALSFPFFPLYLPEVVVCLWATFASRFPIWETQDISLYILMFIPTKTTNLSGSSLLLFYPFFAHTLSRMDISEIRYEVRGRTFRVQEALGYINTLPSEEMQKELDELRRQMPGGKGGYLDFLYGRLRDKGSSGQRSAEGLAATLTLRDGSREEASRVRDFAEELDASSNLHDDLQKGESSERGFAEELAPAPTVREEASKVQGFTEEPTAPASESLHGSSQKRESGGQDVSKESAPAKRRRGPGEEKLSGRAVTTKAPSQAVDRRIAACKRRVIKHWGTEITDIIWPNVTAHSMAAGWGRLAGLTTFDDAVAKINRAMVNRLTSPRGFGPSIWRRALRTDLDRAIEPDAPLWPITGDELFRTRLVHGPGGILEQDVGRIGPVLVNSLQGPAEMQRGA